MSITDDLEPGIDLIDAKTSFCQTANLRSEFQLIVYAFLIEKQHVTVVKSTLWRNIFKFVVELNLSNDEDVNHR